jgi:predicted amidophosphoribosyltransferase
VSTETLVRDLLEVLVVVAIGGMLFSAVRRLRAGALPVYRCPSCERPTTRANGICKHCGTELPDAPR